MDNKMIRFLLLVFCLMLSTFTPAETLRIGTTTENPPFNTLADRKDNFYGFDIDIMGNICQRIQMHCEFIPYQFNSLFPELTAGKIDLVMAGIIITPYREQYFIFSLPYLESTAQFLTLKQSGINTPKDIIHKRIGTRRGTPFRELADQLYKGNVDLISYPSVEALLVGLNEQQIDVVLMDTQAAKNWMANNSMLYKLVGSPIPIGVGYGIVARKDEVALIKRINEAILKMEADGTYLTIYSRYFGN